MPGRAVNPSLRVKAPVIVTVVGVGVGFAAGWGAARLGGQPPVAVIPALTNRPAPVAPTVQPVRPVRPEAEAPLRGLALETALRGALTEPDDELRRERIRALAAATDLEAYADALAKADRILAPADRQSYRIRLLELLTVRDPEAAVAAARATPDNGIRSWVVGSVIQAWARHEHAALVRWFGGQPAGERRALLPQVGTALGLYAPAAGLEFLKGLKSSAEQHAFVEEFFSAWSQRDAAGSFQAGAPVLLAGGFEVQLGQMLGRWAQHDLSAAKAALQQLGAPAKHWAVFQSFFSVVAGENPTAAAELVLATPGNGRQRELVAQLIQEWTQRDANAARQWIERLTDAGLRRSAMTTLVSALISQDPLAAMALLPGLNIGSENTWIYRNLAAKLTEQDPKAALRFLESINGPNLRREVLSGLLDTWSAADPKAAATYAAQLPAGPTRETALNSLMNGWAEHDLKGAVDFVRTLGSAREQNTLLDPLMWRLGNGNPELGKEVIANLPASLGRAQLVGNFASAWVQEDLVSAKAWIESLPEGPVRKAALGALPAAWAQSDPAAAAAYALTLTDAPLQRQFAAEAVQQWTQADPDAALAWAKVLPPGPTREAALQAIAEFHAPDDPRLATELALQLTDKDAQRSSLLNIVANWSNNDPKAAAEWVGAFPAGPLRDDAASQIVNAWAAHDPGATGQWLEQQPAGQGRDLATEAYVTHVREEDPVAAGAWINSMSDDERRQTALEEHVGWWWEQDAKAAKAWLDGLNVSDELKAQWRTAAEARANPAAPTPRLFPEFVPANP